MSSVYISLCIVNRSNNVLFQSFKYAVTQAGNACHCWNSYNMNAEMDNCDIPCTGDSSQTCGGESASQIYVTGKIYDI